MSAPFEYETAILTKGGERRDVNITEASITSHEGKIIVMQDITERKRAETKLAKAVTDLERSNEELEQFAYVASHDLQEPLRMVANFTSLLKERYHGRLDSDADDFIDYAVDGAKRMQKLIQGLLNYSRVSTRGKEFGSVDCEKLLKQTLTSLMTLIEENGAKVTNGALPTILADEDQMLQLFQNLISNSIKFRGDESPRIHISAKDESTGWLFSVRDNGIGIDSQYAERIFLIFQRLHSREEYPGTGIGLAIARRIVERHGGRIWVESEHGKGSTFFFTIPMRREATENEQQ